MIVAVSILGNPCAFDEITALCEEKGIILFEDNCESMGAEAQRKIHRHIRAGQHLFNLFSHHISTMEGGLVLTDDFELYNILKSLRNHGWTRDQDLDSPIFERKKDDFSRRTGSSCPGIT